MRHSLSLTAKRGVMRDRRAFAERVNIRNKGVSCTSAKKASIKLNSLSKLPKSWVFAASIALFAQVQRALNKDDAGRR